MPQELNLNFKNSQQVIINLAQHSPVTVDFVIPLTAEDREEIRRYLEVYPVQYSMDIDDQAADKISNKLLPQFGQKLFAAVFNNDSAKQLFTQFINTPSDKYLLTITAQNPDILSLPWELLHDAGHFLFAFEPSITILRKITPKKTFPTYASQSRLHILFIVSRPQDANFIDPRTDAQAVLKAIADYTAITVEFLQPATLENLWQRLQNSDLPQVDVIHFDGHGIFDKSGDLVKTVIAQLNGISRNLRKQLRDLEIGTNTGYLLFEGYDRRELYVPTSWLNYILSESKIRFIILSACQSAMVVHDNKEIEEEAIGSIAIGLTANSIPNVLAMSYSVMVKATELLFGEFYREIASGNSIGMALDKARQVLLQDRKRRDLQRGQEQVDIKVSDWFLPTLYQASEDIPLVLKMETELPKASLHNLLTLPDAGFWGRSRELWQIDNWFVDGVRRVVVSGFSGQGKTFLVQELGRWLLQKGMFDVVAFVDYSGYQGLDAVQWAVTTLGSVVEQSLVDVNAANVVLQSRHVLLILDNLEVYVKEKQETLQELLTVANQWSLLGESRVLITTRPEDLGHEAYQDDAEGFQLLKLGELNKEDALHYFERLLELSDNPVTLQTDELLRWFAKVQFHPLSIGLLARALEAGDLDNLEERLNQLVLESDNDPVQATLQLVIEQLDEESRLLLPRLGVFQGGAMEDVLLEITEIPTEKWSKLRLTLISTGLMQVENIYGQAYLQFHPSLTNSLQSDSQNDLCYRYQRCYYKLSGKFYFADDQNPIETRAIVKHELPNLLFAIQYALTKATAYAIKFVINVDRFLYHFGFQHKLEQLNKQAAKLTGDMNSQNWYLNKRSAGEQLFNNGHYTKAANIFTEILVGLNTTSSYKICITLSNLGRCFESQGQTEQAIVYYKRGLEIVQKLEQTHIIQRQTGLLYTDLANALTDIGSYSDAQAAYEKNLVIATEQNDIRQIGIINGQLGTLALMQSKLTKAEKYYKTTILQFQQLNEPSHEAIYLHQLGYMYDKTKQWEAAEEAYRQSANIKEAQGNLSGAAKTWSNLAIVMENMGKLIDAEMLYYKVIETDRQFGNMLDEAMNLGNLATLIQNQHGRLPEAQQLAKQALEIFKTLDPARTEIWQAYELLAQIADKQHNFQEAKKNRHLARETKANFAGTRDELKQEDGQLILAVARGKNIEEILKNYSEVFCENLKTAIQQILAGERDVDKLCEPLTYYDAPIITAILEGIENPESLKWFEEN